MRYCLRTKNYTKKSKNKITNSKSATNHTRIEDRLKMILDRTPEIEELPEFYQDYIDITVGVDDFKQALGALNWAYGIITQLEKEYGAKIRKSSSERATGLRKQAYGRISSVVHKIEKDLDFLDFAKQSLRNMPTVDFDAISIVIAGFPNVGKSSLMNVLVGEERAIVTDIAGTTRDSIATLYNKFGHEFMLVDTAGMRKKTKVHEDLEFYSVMRSIRAIEHSDVCILMIDAQTGIESQDMAIFNLIQRNRKGCVVVVNKWDTIEKDSNTMKQYTEAIKERLAPFNDLPIIFTSVINKQRIMDVLDAAAHVYENYSRKISTSRLNEAMLPEIENYPPPAWKGKYIKIKYITQLPTRSPSFAFFCNLPQYIREPYRRFLENKLRSKFDFLGCPVHIFLRQK